jgi:hypothetical protein
MMMLSCVCQAAAAEAMHVRDAVIYRRQLWLQLCALILAPLYLSLSLSLSFSLLPLLTLSSAAAGAGLSATANQDLKLFWLIRFLAHDTDESV